MEVDEKQKADEKTEAKVENEKKGKTWKNVEVEENESMRVKKRGCGGRGQS